MTTPGKVRLRLTPVPLAPWLDGQRFDPLGQLDLDLTPGLHTLTFALPADPKAPASGRAARHARLAGQGPGGRGEVMSMSLQPFSLPSPGGRGRQKCLLSFASFPTGRP